MDESTNDSVIINTNVENSSKSVTSKNVDNSSDDDEAPTKRTKKRIQNLSDSESEKENLHNDSPSAKIDSESDTSPTHVHSKKTLFKSRIVMNGSSSEDETTPSAPTLKNVEQQMRMKNKRSKLKQKFEGLLSSRFKHVDSQNLSNKGSLEDEKSEQSSEPSDSEMSSIACIKQKIKKSMAISSICDPDTSDEESNMNKKKDLQEKKKKVQKSTKMIDAKPMRMSAKQAMQNMQLIKSESNRMLREKAVSLPYHRPKALTLKDIMSRRKPAVASDGKVLPIKMNEEQLKQYALQLEQRQKEMMELCKSESEDDTGKAESDEETATPPPKDDPDKNEVETNPSILEPNTVEKDININATISCTETANDIPTNTNGLDTASNDEKQNNDGNELVNRETTTEKKIDLVANDHSNDIQNEENTDVDNTEKICNTGEVNNADTELGKIDDKEPQEQIIRVCSEQDSQLISLHYTEQNSENFKETDTSDNLDKIATSILVDNSKNDEQDDFFSDDDVNMEDIDKIIENAEIMKDDDRSTEGSMPVRDSLTIKPKLAGAPGMVIDLDGINSKPTLSGVELLKERFIYFSKLKTPEELEREKDKRVKPGSLHLKLKHELEDKIAEQRSLEWAKRLEEEKKLHEEMDSILDDGEEADDSIEKIKAKIDKDDEEEDDNLSESETEDELIENDVEIKDKPIKRNPMLDDEAEESDVEENYDETGPAGIELDENVEEGDNGEESTEDEESSESEEEEENPSKHKKGRILKAFEDSDDEDDSTKLLEEKTVAKNTVQNQQETIQKNGNVTDDAEVIPSSCDIQSSSQDDVIQLAQRHKSVSEDLFTSQESGTIKSISDDLPGTQSFSISSSKPSNFLCLSQPYHDPVLSEVTNTFSQNIPRSQLSNTQCSQSQPIGEDVLALCTGKFYDNEFVSTSDEKLTESIPKDKYLDENLVDKSQVSDTSEDIIMPHAKEKFNISDDNKQDNLSKTTEDNSKKINEGENLLKSIIDELDDPEFDQPKPNKFFTGGNQNKSEVIETSHLKKRLIIDSDDETNETNVEANVSKKKLKKKKLEQRALQISDDEDEEDGVGLVDEGSVSDTEDDEERLVEYDSEENEIEVKLDKVKKKRKMNDFFEQEAELTSEDEWVGSGDEDEHGLDRMEREEGDDEVFHQGQLRKELGQIHMRDVLDQDKREVRLLQELLFEDGDLGGGHRQRKFRWRNAGDEETGTIPNDLTDTQEEEFESEEQWRKQRHEREVFLRQMQQDEEDGSPHVSVNRTTIIKANLVSKSMSTLLMEVNQSKTETVEIPVGSEKKTIKDVPSPKKSFSILQQKYHSSVLNRGNSALARLAALATPLAAADDDAPKTSSLASRKRNFVFAALTQDEDKPKVTIKRKADVNMGTPKLVKKIRLEEKQGILKNSLLDHLNT